MIDSCEACTDIAQQHRVPGNLEKKKNIENPHIEREAYRAMSSLSHSEVGVLRDALPKEVDPVSTGKQLGVVGCL